MKPGAEDGAAVWGLELAVGDGPGAGGGGRERSNTGQMPGAAGRGLEPWARLGCARGWRVPWAVGRDPSQTIQRRGGAAQQQDLRDEKPLP